MDTANDFAIQLVNDYIENVHSLTGFYGYSLAETSNMMWAAEEILAQLKLREKPPLVVIENFRDKMYVYADMSQRSRPIFLSAAICAENIIDSLTE